MEEKGCEIIGCEVRTAGFNEGLAAVVIGLKGEGGEANCNGQARGRPSDGTTSGAFALASGEEFVGKAEAAGENFEEGLTASISLAAKIGGEDVAAENRTTEWLGKALQGWIGGVWLAIDDQAEDGFRPVDFQERFDFAGDPFRL